MDEWHEEDGVDVSYDNDDWRPRRRMVGWFLFAVAVLVLVPIVVSVFFFILRPMSRSYYPFYWYPFFFPFGWIFGFLILFWVLRWLFWPWAWGHRRRYGGYFDEYRILRVRYARGEITKEQFEQMTRDLQEASTKTQKPT